MGIGNLQHRKRAAKEGNRATTRVKENRLPKIVVRRINNKEYYKVYRWNTYRGGSWKLWGMFKKERR